MTGALKPDLHATIARALAMSERRLREVVDEPQAELRMTRLDDVVTDIADLLGPPLQALDGAATEMDLAAPPRSHRAAARGALSLVWTDLMELDPDRMRRAYGTERDAHGLAGCSPAAHRSSRTGPRPTRRLGRAAAVAASYAHSAGNGTASASRALASASAATRVA